MRDTIDESNRLWKLTDGCDCRSNLQAASLAAAAAAAAARTRTHIPGVAAKG